MKFLIATLLPIMAHAATFSVESKAIKNNQPIKAEQVFNGMGCTGQNKSPDLTWSNIPAGTKSFAVTIYDPDAPTGSGWWHWTVFNIPASVHSLAAGASKGKLPAGAVEGRTDFGSTGYGGPCPPPNDKPHHYIINVYAMKTEKIDLPPESSGAMVGFMVNQGQLGKATITGIYGR